MCDFLDLDLAHRKREDLVVAIATGFAVPIDSKHKKKKKTGAFAKAMRAAEELLTLSVCLLEAPFQFTKLGTEQLPRFALDATARGVGAMRNFSGKRVTKRHVIWTSSGEDAAISESSLWKLGLAKEKQERPACARGVRWRD